MNYEIVNLEQKIVVGVSAATSNDDPDMSKIIGDLWKTLYEGGVNASIKNRVNDRAIGLYSDYSSSGYCATAGCEVSRAENEELTVKTIPGGKYARFSVSGNMEKAVAEAWNEIWQMELDRSFTADFEEYLNSDWENAKIDIYIALK